MRRFTRYTLGEGIEVKEEDFAAEVAAMTVNSSRRATADQARRELDALDAS